MTKIDFSIKERLFLINQFEILNAITGRDDYSKKIDILKLGLEHHYDEIIQECDAPMPALESKNVADILQMYQDLQYSYDQLSYEDKEKVKSERAEPKFAGFDCHTEEIVCAGYAEFLSRYGLFSDIVTAYGNNPNTSNGENTQHWDSHGGSNIHIYEAQLAVYKTVWRQPADPLTADEIVTIMTAR